MGALMAFAILPMTAGKAYAEDYELYVGGTPVTSDNALDILGNKTVSYDAESKTLTLNGVTIPEDNTTGILSKIPDLKIEVHGENKLSGQDIGIYSLQNLTITGEGSLEAESLSYGIYSDGDITITDATVSATGTVIYSIGIEATGEIKIEGRSKVQANGSKAIVSANKITLGGGHAITEPVNGRISDDGHYIVDQAGQKAASVTIERVVKMSGDGTAESPYQIKTYLDLQEFASIVNGDHLKAPQNTAACGKLMNDIECSGYKDWVPIGKDDQNAYTGQFDGDNHIIKGLRNELTEDNLYLGLFGYIGKKSDEVKGEVKNVGLEGGKIIYGLYVGGVAGYNHGGTIANCYNTGAVSRAYYVGGVVGYNYGGTITNCYNTGEVSVGGSYVGGVAGYNTSGNIQRGEITNCYNTGAVSGTGYVGGVAGYNYGTIDYCYYNKELNVVKAIGSGTAGTNVEGLETSQMVGAAALNNMTFSYESPSENPWLTKEDGKDADSGTYYEYYPHLKGFAYDISKKAADWPGKLTTSAEWSDDAVSYDYNGSAQGPKVTKVITSQKPVEIPDGMTAEWRKKIVEDVDNPEWGEPIYVEPSLPGVYKLTIKNPKDGDKVIEEIVYIILKKKNSSNSNDYNVKYQVQKKTAGGGTEWSDIDSKDIVDVGNYKAVIELTGRPVLEEKAFQIEPIPLKVTINGSSAQKTYNGKQQTYTGTVTVTSQDKAFDTSKFRYTGSTVVKGTKAGTYTTKLTAKDCAYSDSHYGLQVTVGSPIKLTITEKNPEPKPQPEPVIDKAAAKIALDAGVIARSSGSKVTASWGAVKGASSYVIYANYCSKKTLKKIKTVSGKTTSFDITKLNGKKFNPKKNLKFYVVAYTTVKGKKVKLAKSIMAHAPGSKNSKRTNVTGVKVKKASFKLKKGKTAKIKAKLVLQKKGKKPLKHCAKFRYASSNKKVAKVSKKGKITAIGKGKCTVYVYAVSGVSKKIKVTVK